MKNITEDNAADQLKELETVLQYMTEVDHVETASAMYECLNRLAEKIGRYTNAERVYVFEVDETGQYYVNTVEWCREVVPSYKAALQRLWTSQMPVWYDLFKKRQTIVVANLEAVRETMPTEYAILKPQGVRSLAEFPLYFGSTLLGFVGLDNPDFAVAGRFLTLLEIVSTHLGVALMNWRSDERLKMSRALLDQKEQELEREKLFLDGLCREYIAVWYVNALNGASEPLKLDVSANVNKIVTASESQAWDFDTLIRSYTERFVTEDPKGFLRKLNLENLQRELSQKEHFSFRYRTRPNVAGQQYFEVHKDFTPLRTIDRTRG